MPVGENANGTRDHSDFVLKGPNKSAQGTALGSVRPLMREP